MARAVAAAAAISIATAGAGVASTGSASAVPTDPPTPAAATGTAGLAGLAGQLVAQTQGTVRFAAGTGTAVDFVGGSAEHPLAQGNAADPGGTARAFVSSYGPLLGVADPGQLAEHSRVAAPDGGETVRFAQSAGGVPVLGGDIAVRVDGGGRVLSVLGHASPSAATAAGATPSKDAAAAGAAAVAAIAADQHVDASTLSANPPVLQWYDASVFDRTQPPAARLVWNTSVHDADHHVAQLVLVDAETGAVVLHADQLEHALDRTVCDAATNARCLTEGDPPTGVPDVDAAYQFAGDTYAFYASRFGRDGIDGAGMPIRIAVNFGEDNAFWDGFAESLFIGSGFATDDVLGHEMTHGVTQFTSGLAGFGQADAINESLSDVFGELIDLTNGHGNDAPSVRWKLGEDIAGVGALRDMANPPAFGDPDRMHSPLFQAAFGDPHKIGGVNNKAAFLITDGGTFNGQTVTGLGIDKAARIYYEVDANLLVSGSDFDDLGNALVQGCTNLIGTHGFTAGDCTQVAAAVTATEMHLAPTDPAEGTADAPVCPAGLSPRDMFRDDLEDPLSGNWSLDNATNGAVTPGWGYETGISTSGTRALLGLLTTPKTDKKARLTQTIPVPAGQPSFLRFSHDEQFLSNPPGGQGVAIEYSANGGATWNNLGPFATDNPENGAVVLDNVVIGAFTGFSPGFTASRFALGTFANQNLQFRFRLMSAFAPFTTSWALDDVRIYTCTATPAAPDAPSGAMALAGTGQAVVSWRPPTSDGGGALTGYTVTASPGGATTTVGASATSAVVTGLPNGTPVTFTVRATNGVGSSPPSTATAAVMPTVQGGALFHPLTPDRIVDSRLGTGTTQSRWNGGETRSVAATGVGGVPSTHVSAVVANLTVTNATAPSHLTVWPTGQPKPTASNLNFVAGQTVANHITVGVGTNGRISVFDNAGQTDVIVDVLGYYDDGTTGGDAFTSVTPTRLLDTRDGTGGSSLPWGEGEARNLGVAGATSPVPPGATAVVLNVTGVFPSRDTHISVWPAGQGLPFASSVNVPAGGVVPNLVTVKVGTGGQVRLRNNSGTMHILADVVGYYAPAAGGGRFVALTPHRVLDSRDGTGILGLPWPGSVSRDIRVAGEGGVPGAGASAVVLNVTAVGPSLATHITCFPAATARPDASNLNLGAGQSAANQVVVRIGGHGAVTCFNNQGNVHLVVDVVGYLT